LGNGHSFRIVSTLAAKVDQTAPEVPLVHGRRIRCPWCEAWEPEESYTELQTPPNYPQQCAVVLKHGGERGCKKIFSLRRMVRLGDGS
jgi:hypothetical protein